MRFLPFLTFYLLCNLIGVYYNPPDVVVWVMLLALFVLGLYVVSEYSLLPSWYVALIYRIQKFILRV